MRWNSNYNESSEIPVGVAGLNNPLEIASTFKDYYSNIYVKSSDDDDAANAFFDLINGLESNISDELPQIDGELVESCIKQLELGKSAGADSIVAEQIVHCYPSIIIHIKLLFTMMVSHSYVSKSCGAGIIITVPKDESCDLSSLDNYRLIPLSPVFSKLFELVLIYIFGYLIVSDDLQFDFQNKFGCPNALFVLRQVVNYFNERNSNVYIASLDVSKAFDRVNHHKLFSTLIKNNLPSCCVKLLSTGI